MPSGPAKTRKNRRRQSVTSPTELGKLGFRVRLVILGRKAFLVYIGMLETLTMQEMLGLLRVL